MIDDPQNDFGAYVESDSVVYDDDMNEVPLPPAIQLPHQCDAWHIGGSVAVRMLIDELNGLMPSLLEAERIYLERIADKPTGTGSLRAGDGPGPVMSEPR